jgi:hypothetical protein
VTAEELAARHPRLFHVTTPGVGDRLEKEGLLSTAALLMDCGLSEETRHALTRSRRPTEVQLEHPLRGRIILNDNTPLSEKKLTDCLDDDLSSSEWLEMLNARVFFWADEAGLARLTSARANRGRIREVLVFDTLSLVREHEERVEISPINSGATIRRPARRGRSTFAPLQDVDYPTWRLRRGQRDRIVEIVVRDHVRDAARHLVERREIGGA